MGSILSSNLSEIANLRRNGDELKKNVVLINITWSNDCPQGSLGAFSGPPQKCVGAHLDGCLANTMR